MTKRLLELDPTSLFGDEAILTALSGREELSSPFEFMLTIASTNEKLKPEQIIGQPLAVRINRDDADPRYIHGYVNSFLAGNTVMPDTGVKAFRMYRVRIVPWLWFMSRASRCFVYLPEKAEKSIQDVLNEIIKRVKSYGHVDPVLESGNAKVLAKRKVEHCVQYRETDLNFFSRTLERYGIYYYFKFINNKHTLVLSDQLNYPNAPEAEVRYPHSHDVRGIEDMITHWEHAYEFVTGKWEQTDYDFTHPSTDLKVNAQKHSSITLKNNAAYEYFEYPGEFVKKDDGEAEVAIRLEAEESRFNTVTGSSTCKSFSPGYCFKLTEHLNCKDETGKEYLITSVAHSASQPGPFNTDASGAVYANSFTCIPKNSQYRPARSTPQPLLSGVQTAVVVGPPGEEIYTDEHGRVKVQFHWDREGKKDEHTSCWLRVCQVHAGKGFGGIDIPRCGEEVVVSFLEGDLDRPIITGRVYHKESMPPFGLPAAKTVSGMKTQTYKGKGHNEMSMNDTPGKEMINVHAQYDMVTTVQHDETLHVVSGNRKINVDSGTHTETIQGNTTIKIVTGNLNHDVQAGTATYHVTGAVVENLDATQATTVKNKIDIKSTASEIVIDGKTKITLVSGASKITLDASGVITMEAKTINIIASDEIKESALSIGIMAGNEAKLGVASQNIICDKAKTAISGTAINSSAVGMHEISGALVKIN